MVISTETELHRDEVALRSVVGSVSLMTGIFVMNFMCRVICSPLMPTIEDDLGIGHGEAGSVFLLISAGYFVTLVGSGFFSSRFTHRKTIASTYSRFDRGLILTPPSIWATHNMSQRSLQILVTVTFN